MRRFLIALVVFLTATVSQTFAGYIVIRVLLEGSGGDSGTTPTSPGGKMPSPGKYQPGYDPKGSQRPPTPGMPPMPGGSTTPTNPTDFDHTRSVVVVIPQVFLEGKKLAESKLDKSKAFNEKDNPKFSKFVVSYYGKDLHASLFPDGTSIQLYETLMPVPQPKKTRHTEMLDKYAQWLGGKKDPQLLYDALILALESGYIRAPVAPMDGSPARDAITFAQELLAVAAETKSLPPNVDRFVKAWGAMSRQVRAPAQQPSNAEYWKDKLSTPSERTDVRTDGHYALIYWDGSETEATRRTRQLNDNFIAFYLLHATRGTVLPVPAKPLVVVLARQGKEMHRFNHALDGLPIQGDAFYAPDHDLLVLSPERLDGVGRTFFQQTQQVFGKGWSRDLFLDGQFPKLDHTGEKGVRPNDVARATTLAVVEKLVLDEAEIAAVSREGTRQLLFATHQLPKHVTLPNWLTNGAVNSFARPRGPAYVTMGDDDKPYMHVALTTGYGVPNYVLLRYYRDILSHEEPNAGAAELTPARAKLLEAEQNAFRTRLLEHVLTDAYFAGIKDADDPDPAPPKKKTGTDTAPPPKTGPGAGVPYQPPFPKGGTGGPPFPKEGPGMPYPKGPGGYGQMPGTLQPGSDGEDPAVTQRKKRERLAIKAQATAWALYFYLAREKPELLKQYIDELNKLPRDLPIDGRTAYGAFIRVFDLGTADGHANPQKMKDFANDWMKWMETVPKMGFDIELVLPEPPKEESTNPKGPMYPKGPPGPVGPKGPGGNQ